MSCCFLAPKWTFAIAWAAHRCTWTFEGKDSTSRTKSYSSTCEICVWRKASGDLFSTISAPRRPFRQSSDSLVCRIYVPNWYSCENCRVFTGNCWKDLTSHATEQKSLVCVEKQSGWLASESFQSRTECGCEDVDSARSRPGHRWPSRDDLTCRYHQKHAPGLWASGQNAGSRWVQLVERGLVEDSRHGAQCRSALLGYSDSSRKSGVVVQLAERQTEKCRQTCQSLQNLIEIELDDDTERSQHQRVCVSLANSKFFEIICCVERVYVMKSVKRFAHIGVDRHPPKAESRKDVRTGFLLNRNIWRMK